VLLEHAAGVARRMAAVPAAAFRLTKQQRRAPYLERARTAAELDAAVLAEWAAPQTAEVIRAYLERTVGKGGG
jgi:hypothetical protein